MKHGLKILTLLAVLVTGITVDLQPAMASSWERGDLEVDLWLNKSEGAIYRHGQHVNIRFRANADCYVAVYNVDSEGFVHLLFPKVDDRNYVEGKHTYRIPSSYDEYDLVVNGPRGIEYIVAVASPYPMNLNTFNPLYNDGYDDYFAYSGRIIGDPSQAIWDLNERLVWADDSDGVPGYSSDISWFYVREQVPYPRYLVYDWWPSDYRDSRWDPYGRNVVFIDFYWDHAWCHSSWWWRGHRPSYHYWYLDSRNSRKHRWKSNFYHHTDAGHEIYRVKAPRFTREDKRSSRVREDAKGSRRYLDKNPRREAEPRRSIAIDSKGQRPQVDNRDRNSKPDRVTRERDSKPQRENQDRDSKPRREQKVERERWGEKPAVIKQERVKPQRQEQVKPKREEKQREKPAPRRDDERKEKSRDQPKPRNDDRATRRG